MKLLTKSLLPARSMLKSLRIILRSQSIRTRELKELTKTLTRTTFKRIHIYASISIPVSKTSSSVSPAHSLSSSSPTPSLPLSPLEACFEYHPTFFSSCPLPPLRPNRCLLRIDRSFSIGSFVRDRSAEWRRRDRLCYAYQPLPSSPDFDWANHDLSSVHETSVSVI